VADQYEPHSLFDNDHEYFPTEIWSERIEAFAVPFFRLMIVAAQTDHEINRVVAASTGNADHEDEFRRGSVSNLARDVKRFVKANDGDLSEFNRIRPLLKSAKSHYLLRNSLAHGDWWRYDPKSLSVSIRQDRGYAGEDRFREVSVTDIENAIFEFQNIEADLYNVRRKIEKKGIIGKKRGSISHAFRSFTNAIRRFKSLVSNGD